MTKPQFLSAYKAALVEQYTWTADTAKLARFMESVEQTLGGGASTWAWDGAVARNTWRALGGVPKDFSLRALRALPEV